MKQQCTKLPNGLTVASVSMPQMASVSVGLWVGVGGRHEPESLNGVCHFIEHVLFKGTARRTAKGISQAVEGIGGYLNAFTGEESTCFYAKARHDRLESLLDVLTDMFLNSRFEAEEIDKERSVIKEEVAMYLDQPQHQVHDLLNATLWPGHPLGRPLAGSPETLDRMTRTELLAFKQSHYVTEGTLIVAAGRVSHAALLRHVSRYARRFPQGPRACYPPVREATKRPLVRLQTKEVEQTQLALAFRTCSRHDPRRYALRLLNTILGENMSSRLFQVVREDRGLAYSVYSSLSYFDDAGALVVSLGLDTANASQALRLVMSELRRLADRSPGAAEFRRARDYVLGQMDMSLEGTEPQMLWVGEQLLGYGRVRSAAAIKRQLAQATPAHVRAVARDFFRSDRAVLAVVSPMKSARPLSRLLTL